jgi:hypothetical protein
MMENRSFDHVVGGLKPAHAGIVIWPSPNDPVNRKETF